MKTPYQFVLPFGLSDEDKRRIDTLIQNITSIGALADWVRSYTSNFREPRSIWSWEEWRRVATQRYPELLEWLKHNEPARNALAQKLHATTHFNEDEILTYLAGGER